MIYLIEELWTDSMENRVECAIGWRIIGYCTDRAQADAAVSAAGLINGTGWPIPHGESLPRLKVTPVAALDSEGFRKVSESAP